MVATLTDTSHFLGDCCSAVAPKLSSPLCAYQKNFIAFGKAPGKGGEGGPFLS